MSSQRSNSPPSSASPNAVPPHGRRASVTGSSLTDLFARSGNVPPPPPLNTAANNNNNNSNAGSIFNNPAAHQKRRTSITTLGLSGSPTTQQSHFGPASATSAMRRRGSVSSSVMSTSPNVEQAVVEEEEGDIDTPMTTPTSPFARRVSFGTRSNANGRYPFKAASYRSPSFSQSYSYHGGSINGSNTTSPSSPSSVEGFNWPEALRTRAERAPSISFSSTSPTKPMHPQNLNQPQNQNQNQPPTSTDSPPARHHHRAASIATMEASPGSKNNRQQQPPKEFFERQSPPMPPAQNQSRARQRPKPDYFQEKILRADFMD